MDNENMQKLTTIEKKRGIISNYDDISKEYAKDFFYDTSDNKYIDIFLQNLNGMKILDAGCGNGDS